MEQVQFFLPREHWPCDPLPGKADNPLHYHKGILSHTLQTYIHLKNAGYPCKLVDKLPRRGLVASHQSLIARARFSPDLFLINMLADRGPHCWAQAVVVQNPVQAERAAHTLIPFWPQPGLIPRDSCRGDRFEVVAYFGRSYNLAAELCTREWENSLSKIGLTWRIVGPPRNDYHDVDAVVAARDFSASTLYDFKPANKLVNAWLAGSIPLVAPEPAHTDLRLSDLDYLSVSSANHLLQALIELKKSPELRRAFMARACERSQEFAAERITQRWCRYLDEVAQPAYRAWQRRSRPLRWLYYARCLARWPAAHHERKRIMKDWRYKKKVL